MDQKNSRIRRSEPLTNRTSSKVKFGKGKGGFPMPSFLSPSPLTSLSHLWRVLVKGESGSKDTLRCSMGWRMWSFHKTFDATRSYGWRQPYRSFNIVAIGSCFMPSANFSSTTLASAICRKIISHVSPNKAADCSSSCITSSA